MKRPLKRQRHPKLVVYTAITGSYDILSPPPSHWLGLADFVAFVDAGGEGNGWTTRPIHRAFEDPCRNAKIHKLLPHIYFPGYAYSLWLDGNVSITCLGSPWDLIAEYLEFDDLAVYRHRYRKCAYKEAFACIESQKDSVELIKRQMTKYWDEGYPMNHGLAECPVILRRHSAKTRKFNEAWYAEICSHSRRDQLSFNYTAARLGFNFRYFKGEMSKGTDPMFTWTAPHRSNLADSRDIVQMPGESGDPIGVEHAGGDH